MTQITRGIAGGLMLAAALAAAPASAQDVAAPATTPQAEQARKSPFGIGFQSSWPAWGISGVYDVNEQITAQAIVGAFGTLTTIGARGLYRFLNDDVYDLYGFGTVGMWSYPYHTLSGRSRENVIGFGGGGGIELSWQRILASNGGNFPPLYSTVDLGLVVANFDHYNFSGFAMGVGLHYRF